MMQMEERSEILLGRQMEERSETHVQDASLDYKGRPPLRASTGSWKASFFIVALEFSEKISFFGIGSNMITYLTTVMHQNLEIAVNSVNVWFGVTAILPLLCGFIADAFTGRFFMILFSAVLYVIALSLFTMTQYIPSLKPCSSTLSTCQQATNVHKVLFFVAAYIMSLATGGYRPCLETFGADQFDDNHAEERKRKMSFFNWWNIAICLASFTGVTVIVYIEDNVGWGVAFLIIAITMVMAGVIFITGRPYYRYRVAQGSPITPLCQVLVAAFVKRNLPYPSDPSLLYEPQKHQGRPLDHTNRLRFLDKASIVEEYKGGAAKKQQSSWRLATLTQVEEMKLVINMIPIWLTSLVFGIGLAQSPTFVNKQGSAMDRRIFSHFDISPPNLGTLGSMGALVTMAIYDRILIPHLRRVTGNERGLSILNRIGIGMILLIITMIVSALVERERLRALQDGKILSIFWLAPQTLILGIGDGFSLVGMQEFFYEQVPDSMRSLGMAFYLCLAGVGGFASTLLIIVVNSVTGMNGGKKWIGKDVNHSRLDYFYWLLAVIFGLNLCVFTFLAKDYKYKNVKPALVSTDSYEDAKAVEGTGV